jgi:hypothetical protein
MSDNKYVISAAFRVAVLLVGLTLYHGFNPTVTTIMLFLDAWPDIPDANLQQAEGSSTGRIPRTFLCFSLASRETFQGPKSSEQDYPFCGLMFCVKVFVRLDGFHPGQGTRLYVLHPDQAKRRCCRKRPIIWSMEGVSQSPHRG